PELSGILFGHRNEPFRREMNSILTSRKGNQTVGQVIRVLHTASADASLDIRTEEVSGSIATPIGTEMLHVHRHALTITQMSDAEILERRWLRAANISEFREHTPGMESPHTIT